MGLKNTCLKMKRNLGLWSEKEVSQTSVDRSKSLLDASGPRLYQPQIAPWCFPNWITVKLLTLLIIVYSLTDWKTNLPLVASLLRGYNLTYLKRKLCVSFNNVTLIFPDVKYGAPQGSVLVPLLFSLYNSPLGQIICN